MAGLYKVQLSYSWGKEGALDNDVAVARLTLPSLVISHLHLHFFERLQEATTELLPV